MTEALRQAAENAADVLDEARTYVGCESWSPSMLEECERALRMLRAALAQPPAPAAQPVQQPGAEPDECQSCRGAEFKGWKRGVKCAECDGSGSRQQAAPAQRQPLTVPALTDAQMSECAWGYVADSRNLDAGVTGIIQATQLACAAAWGVTLAQKGEKL